MSTSLKRGIGTTAIKAIKVNYPIEVNEMDLMPDYRYHQAVSESLKAIRHCLCSKVSYDESTITGHPTQQAWTIR